MEDKSEVNMGNKVSIAFLIVAHQNPEQLNLFIHQLLTYSESYIYIHVDEKSLDMIPKLLRSARVTILPKHFNIRWGDYTQILANNYLLQYALRARSHTYYSLHSGADLAIRPIQELADYLKESNSYGYYDCQKLPCGWQYGGGLGRLALYWPSYFRKRLSRHSPLRYLRSIYGRLYGIGLLKGKKLPVQYPLYGGADWFTIREDCARNVLRFLEQHPDFDSLFIDSLSGAEIYYVTLFQLTKEDNPVESSNMLRYIDWKNRGQNAPVGAPNICSMDFLDEIEESQCYFARKFDMHFDQEIVSYFLKITATDTHNS